MSTDARQRRRVHYLPCHDAAEVTRLLRTLDPRTAIIDIEPLVATWNTGNAELDAGITALLSALAADPGRLRDVVFATNSARQPSEISRPADLRVHYVSHAGKPLRARSYRQLARPGVVVGDQIATDGILAWRLGLTFVHYVPRAAAVPTGPPLLRALGQPLRRVLFQSS